MPAKTFALLVVIAVIAANILTGCSKFNPPWGGSAW